MKSFLLSMAAILAMSVAAATEVPRDVTAAGGPLTSVVVTACNKIVVIYITNADGTLSKYDKSSGVSPEDALNEAKKAPYNQRVEVGCVLDGGVTT